MNRLKKNAVVFLLAVFVFSSFTVTPVFAQEVPLADGSGNNTPTIDPNTPTDSSTGDQTPPSGSIGGDETPLIPTDSNLGGDGNNGSGSSEGTPTGTTNPTGPTNPGNSNQTGMSIYTVQTGTFTYKGTTYTSTETYMNDGETTRLLYSITYSAASFGGANGITLTGVEARIKTYDWQTGAVVTDMSTIEVSAGPYEILSNGWRVEVSGSAMINRNNLTGAESGSGMISFSGRVWDPAGVAWFDDGGTWSLVDDPNNPGHLIWVEMSMPQMP